MAEIEYGFPNLRDAFNILADERGHDEVGAPLHAARYIGDALAYQYTTRGKLEAVKVADSSWKAYFFPEGIASSIEQTLTAPAPLPVLARPVYSLIRLNADNPFGAADVVYDRLGYKGHPGIDYKCAEGTTVYACDDGEVTYSGDAGSAGAMVAIRHSHGQTRYLHLSHLVVRVGDDVERGEEIAWSGNTGLSTGPHLHLDYFPDGEDEGNGYSGRVDPLLFMSEG